MDALVITGEDNVAIAVKDINKQQRVKASNGDEITARDDIPYTHKIAMTDIGEGQLIVKYGVGIAVAASDIKRGMWVHVHNVKGFEK